MNGVMVVEGVGLLVELVMVLETMVKLAHVKRVALVEWMTMDLSPKKYGLPGVVLRYRSVYMTFQLAAVMFPCLPAKSPAWQVWGAAASQAWSSPRMVGSR